MQVGGLQPFTLSDYPGYSAAIIFTIGCNFRCPCCHNKMLWHEDAERLSEQQVFDFLVAHQGKLDGIVITGGEPTIQPALEKFLQAVKSLNYRIKLDTNGSNPEILRRVLDLGLVNYIAMDVKAPFHLYQKLAGVTVCTADILTSINLIIQSKIKHIFRTTWDKDLLTEYDMSLIRELPISDNFIIQECKS